MEFAQITLLATPTGKVQIVDEATFPRHAAGSRRTGWSRSSGLFECAYCAVLRAPRLLEWRRSLCAGRRQVAALLAQAGQHALARAAPQLQADGRALEAAIVELFRQKEARGQHCVVEQYRRGNREYYFAYPQDHKQS